MTQALTVSFVNPGGVAGTLDMEAIDGSDLARLSKCLSGPGTVSNIGEYLAPLFGKPNIVAEGVFDNDATPAATQLVDLTDKGVTFPASTVRTIRWRHLIQSDNDRFVVDYEQDVLGGTTPALLGTRRVRSAFGVVAGTTVEYGNIRAQATYSTDTATAVAANSTAGSSLGNNSTNTVTLTHPVARTSPKNFWVNVSPDVATVTEQLHGGIVATNTTTASIFLADLATPSADGFDDAGTIDAYGYILPPGDAVLALNTNNVELQITGIASDETRHRVELWISPQVSVLFQGS